MLETPQGELIKDIEANFKKKYNFAQKRIIENHLKGATTEQMAILFDRIVSAERSIPLPIKIAQILKGVQHDHPREANKDDEYQIQCQTCMDTGWAFTMIESSVDVLLKCSCEIGKQNDDPVHPTLDGTTKPFLRKFPTGRFRPTASESMDKKIEWWTTTKKISAAYWQDKLKPHNHIEF